MPEPIDLASEMRRRKALADIERTLTTIERLLARARGPERRALESQRAALLLQRDELRRAILTDTNFENLRDTWRRDIRSPNFGGRIDASWPILLFPLKLETRFVRRETDPLRPFELRIRFYPDRAVIQTHEESLTAEERAGGAAFWAQIESAQNDEDKRSAWSALLRIYGHERAAFIAHRTNPSLNAEASPPPRMEAWSAAPVVNVFPEYLHVRGYVGSQVAFTEMTKNPIDANLLVGLDPQTTDGGARPVPQSPQDFLDGIPPEIRWLVDFDEAERRGLSMRIPVTETAATRGFDRLLVAGVRIADDPQHGASVLEQLLEGHRFSDGLAVVPRATATNNTESADAGFNSEPDVATTYELEFGQSRWQVGDVNTVPPAQRDAQILARGLGIDPAVFERVEFAEAADDIDAFHMARALWPATLGYYLRQMLADEVPKSAIADIRDHYLHYVRTRGPLPNLRVERTPYGVLPVTSLRALKDDQSARGMDQWLPDLLWRLRQDWLTMSTNAPRLTGADDPDRALFDVMSMLPISARFYSSAVLGEEFLRNLVNLLVGGNDRDDISKPILEEAEGAVDDALNTLGYPGRKPRVRSLSFKKPVPVEEPFLVAPTIDTTPFPPASADNYLLWLASATPEEFEAESGLPANARSVLLYRLLRTARRNAFVETAFHITIDPADRLRTSFRFEAEIEDLPGWRGDPPGQILKQTFAGTIVGDRRSGMTIGRLLHGVARKDFRGRLMLGARDLRTETSLIDELSELTDSLEYLAGRPKDKLQVAMCETVDGGSHRLDAWITSLATKELMNARRATDRARGLYIGAFGWLENVRRKTGARNDGGFVLAPSLDQAAAAAVLRNGFIAHRGGAQASELAVKLSSERVKTAMDFFDRLRSGIPLAAALGYDFQRGLHDRGAELGLEQYLPALQDEFPLDSGELTPHSGPTEEVAARNVVNGRDLLQRWTAFKSSSSATQPGARLFGRSDLPAVGTPPYRGVSAEIDRLAEAFDAMKDVALAEAVHQNVRGNYEAARAVSDAMAGSRHMPELDFPHTRPKGPRLKHRVVVSLPTRPDAAGGWPAAATPRAAAAPELNRLVRRLVGDPRQVGIYVRHEEATTDPDALPRLKEEVIALDALDIDAIDTLEFTISAGPAQLSELELRVLRVLRKLGVTGRRLEISFSEPPSWGRSADTPPRPQRTWAEVAPLIESLRQALSHARAALPVDLTHPDSVGEAALESVDFGELVNRCKAAVTGLWSAYQSLTTALAPFAADGAAPPTDDELNDIGQRSAALAGYGSADALTPSVVPLRLSETEQQNAKAVLRREFALQAEATELFRRLLGTAGGATPDIAAFNRLRDELDAQLQSLAQPVTQPAATLPPDQLTAAQRLAEDIQKEAQRTALLGRCQQILQTLFGRGFLPAFRFPVAADHPLRASYDGLLHRESSPPSSDQIAHEEALNLWLYRMGEIHEAVGDFGRAVVISEVQTGSPLQTRAAQLPYTAGERQWAGIVEDPNRIPADGLSILFTGAVAFGEAFCGVVLSDWEETIPAKSATAGLTFHFDQPGSEPPQVLLLAVAPPQAGSNPRWTADLVFEILGETLDLARVRLVDSDLINKYGPLTPMTFLPYLSFDPNVPRGWNPL